LTSLIVVLMPECVSRTTRTVASATAITAIVPPVMSPAIIAPAMIPPVITAPYADHDSRVVVDRRGRSVVDARGGVIHRWGHEYRRYYTDTDPDMNIGLSGCCEPRKKRGAE
jgi:hypothetical protein